MFKVSLQDPRQIPLVHDPLAWIRTGANAVSIAGGILTDAAIPAVHVPREACSEMSRHYVGENLY